MRTVTLTFQVLSTAIKLRPEALLPDRRRQKKSKYTADRNIPGAFEGETVTRRTLMNIWANGAGGVAAAAFTLPALGFAIAPIYFERAEGPPHDRRFTSQVRIADEIVGEGIGASKKAAQQSAAAMALAYLRNRHPEPEPPESPPPSPPPEGRVIALRPSRNRTKAP